MSRNMQHVCFAVLEVTMLSDVLVWDTSSTWFINERKSVPITPSGNECVAFIKPRPSLPWQVLFARVYGINWQVSPWQGKLSRETRIAKENLVVCIRSLKLVQRYTRANKTCQGKTWSCVYIRCVYWYKSVEGTLLTTKEPRNSKGLRRNQGTVDDSNANWDRSKRVLDRSKWVWTLSQSDPGAISVWMACKPGRFILIGQLFLFLFFFLRQLVTEYFNCFCVICKA